MEPRSFAARVAHVRQELKLQGKALPLDGVMVQTMLTKCLGPLSEWDAMMELPVKCGFNTIHFSPLQHLGHSGSCYSIYDQLLLSKAIFPVRVALTALGECPLLMHSIGRGGAERGGERAAAGRVPRAQRVEAWAAVDH